MWLRAQAGKYLVSIRGKPGIGSGVKRNTSEASLRSPRFSASSPEDRNVDSLRPGPFQPMSRQYLNKDDTLAIVRIWLRLRRSSRSRFPRRWRIDMAFAQVTR